jgi:arylsulfatase A-like enzyme
MKIAAVLGLALLVAGPVEAAPARNIVIFVADGLRYGSVEPGNMPNLFRVKTEGVDFTNSHSLYPTITTVNASAIATGHYIGDTGDFGNTLYTGVPMISLKGSTVGFLENDTVLDEMNGQFGGNYLNETTLIARARMAGFATAIIGKEGPARIQDSTAANDGTQTLILDDSTGSDGGIGLPGWFTRQMKDAFVGSVTPKPSVPNIDQEVNLMKATTRIVLPHFAQSGKPFALLFWSRDPDMSQHNTKDSVGEYDPGINGSSGKAGTRNADTMLGGLLAALKEQGLDKTTDVFVTADHGFITVSHASLTSPSAEVGQMGSGFLLADLATGLGLAKTGAYMLGGTPAHPEIVVAPNGGSDLIYLPNANANAKQRAGDIVRFLLTQDYVSGIFVNDTLGKFPGALPMSAVGLIGSARTPVPAIYVSFRTFAQECPDPLQCTVGVHDTPLATGQGSHGSFSRAETRNFMAAIGPDFKAGYADPAPVSNADIAPTMAHLAGLDLPAKGRLRGRVIGEALTGGAEAVVTRNTLQSEPGENGLRTVLNRQQVGDARYFDAAGFLGRTVGLTPP